MRNNRAARRDITVPIVQLDTGPGWSEVCGERIVRRDARYGFLHISCSALAHRVADNKAGARVKLLRMPLDYCLPSQAIKRHASKGAAVETGLISYYGNHANVAGRKQVP